MADKQASRTAVLVCQGRAVGDGWLATERFGDPVALPLLTAEERGAVEQARSGTAPRGWRPRMEYELLRATATVLATRTVVIDDAVRERATPQVVILGAGLDGRAWRMDELAGTDVYEVDHPASQANKRERAAGLTPVARSLTYVPVDFGRSELGAALVGAGHRSIEPTTWIWEGVLPYLTEPEVDATLSALVARSAPGSRVIATYHTPNRLAWLGRLGMRVYSRLSGSTDPLKNEPQVSAWTPGRMHAILEGHGLEVAYDRALYPVARELRIPAKRSRAYGLGRIVLADMAVGDTAP